jgi:hypothetical protein
LIVGADGVRLHEEVLHAGGWTPEQGRFRRVENLGLLADILDRAIADGTPGAEPVRRRIAERWTRISDGLLRAIDWRTTTRLDSLRRALSQREDTERKRITTTIDHFSATLRSALAEDQEDALFSRLELEKTRDEREQYRRDRRRWEARLTELAAERQRELDAIAARYRHQEPHRFPVAVVFVVPKREAIR